MNDDDITALIRNAKLKQEVYAATRGEWRKLHNIPETCGRTIGVRI